MSKSSINKEGIKPLDVQRLKDKIYLYVGSILSMKIDRFIELCKFYAFVKTDEQSKNRKFNKIELEMMNDKRSYELALEFRSFQDNIKKIMEKY